MDHSLTTITHRSLIGDWLNQQGLTNFAAEIGVAYGENANEILTRWKGRLMFLIDPWRKWKHEEYTDGTNKIDFDGCLKNCQERLLKHAGRTCFLQMTSNEALLCFPKVPFLDFVYLDGNHHFPQIEMDVRQWWELIVPGGLFGGHDYYDKNDPDFKCNVKQMVNVFVGEKKLPLHTTFGDCEASWWTRKPI